MANKTIVKTSHSVYRSTKLNQSPQHLSGNLVDIEVGLGGNIHRNPEEMLQILRQKLGVQILQCKLHCACTVKAAEIAAGKDEKSDTDAEMVVSW